MKINDNKDKEVLGGGVMYEARFTLPNAKDEEPFYRPMLQGTGTNDLSRIYLDKEPLQADLITGKATIDYGDDFVLTIDDYKKGYKLVASTQKLFDTIAIAFTGQVSYRQKTPITKEQRTISYPLKRYVRDLGKDPENKKDVDNVREAVKKDLENLFRVRISWKEKGKGKLGDFRDKRIVDDKGLEGGNITARITEDIAEYLANAYIMNYPNTLTAISCQQTPLPYYIGRKLALQHSIENNKKTGTANIIGVETLINHLTPDLLPTYKEVKESNNRSPYRRIIEPIEHALDMLVENGTLTGWCYCDKKKVRLTDKKLEAVQRDYNAVKDAYILFTMKGDEDIPLTEPPADEKVEAK